MFNRDPVADGSGWDATEPDHVTQAATDTAEREAEVARSADRGLLESLRRGSRFLQAGGGGIRSQVVRSGFWVSLSLFSVVVLQLARSVVLARLLAPEIFGLMAICLIVIRGLDLFSEAGVRPALIHRQKSFDEARDTAFCIMVSRGALLAVLSVTIAPFAAGYYHEPPLSTMIRVLGLSFLLTGLGNINAIALEKDLNFRRLAIAEQAAALTSFIVVVGLAYYLRSVWALVIGHVLGALISVVLSYVAVPGRPNLRFNWKIARELLGYGRFVTGLTIVLFLTTELDNLVVGKLLGMEALGYYLVAYTFANLPTTHVSKVVARVMFPTYSKLQSDRARLETAYLAVLQVVATFAMAMMVGTVVLSEDIIRVIYGERWLPAVDALRILAVFGGIRAISIMGYVYNAIGKPEVNFYINLAKLVVIVAAIVPATRNYGLVGASLAVTIPAVLFHFVGAWLMVRVTGIAWRKSLTALVRPVLASFVMGLALYAGRRVLEPVGLSALIVLTAVGAAICLLLNLGPLRRLYREHWLRMPAAA